MKISQLTSNIKSAFLNGTIDEDIFVGQPEGYIESGMEDKVCKLVKALYGLKQAPRASYERMDTYLQGLGFNRSNNKHTLYVKSSDKGIQLIISLYVDGMLITSPSGKVVDECKAKMQTEFEMSDLGKMSYFLGMIVDQGLDYTLLRQKKYAYDLLNKCRMESCKSVATPSAFGTKLCRDNGSAKINETYYRRLIRSLLYLSSTRPDIMYFTSLVSRFMHRPSKIHLCAAKRVLRYVKGTVSFGLKFYKNGKQKLLSYCDSDWGGSLEDLKSTGGYCFSFGSVVFAWNSKKQDIVAQSCAEAEYVATASAANRAIWLRKILQDLKFSCEEPTTLCIDNKFAISIAKNPVDHGRTKHIRIKFHALREVVKKR
ncbi:Cysteine-rich RLK (RECEPTOR-like protein kinase) 8 [Theobroma cacao]|uniref:Cysteine-rich RLK (RECEPTOR-like protein kinase) 8 n=1 Tax=Theobroma cacao TaxID=3641 RepID=A0A061FG64_THECC|nr:Cysteine-rich RLK (RECEPTOR-like protein kinase) 8 [Theobroma cacao]